LLFLHVFGPGLLGLIAALALVMVRRVRSPRLQAVGAVRGWTITGALLAVIGLAGPTAIGMGDLLHLPLPRLPPGFVYSDYRFIAPLATGFVAVLALTLPVVRRTGAGTAELARRTVARFAPRPWFRAAVVTVAVILALTTLTGLVSRPDPDGRYTAYWVDFGASAFGTTIYGWHFSIPCLVALAILSGGALSTTALIARPPLASDRGRDVAVRVWRTRNTLAMTVGSLLLHLSVILSSLYGVASVRGSANTDHGAFHFGTPLESLAGALQMASAATAAAGWFCWFVVLFAAAIGPSPVRVLPSRSRG